MILFFSLLSVQPAHADVIQLRSDAPERHVVVQGDTLWDIASRFLNDPWLWPQVWGLNREQVRNPHKIYPGDVIVLERTLQGIRLTLATDKETIKLSPTIRSTKSSFTAIPSIPASAIEPFLSQPLVIEKNSLANAPYLLGTSDNRVILAAGNTVYASNLPDDKGKIWQIFRPGKALIDPDRGGRILGYEATYLGDSRVNVFDDISTMTITSNTQEILKGDRLVPAPGMIFNNYVPRAPEQNIKGRIISVYGGVTQIGKGAIITLNQGAEDGLEMGHVLAVNRRSQAKTLKGKIVELPEE
ncbi:MAG: LysM peptidoglycan-binding domain-containing protein, partial [Nitrosomonas sp.]|nr:LysM peptidoglycan-binding domain-containing protein [Nitrosomonas sp.]